MLFFCHVCVLLLMSGVFDSTIYFVLSWCYFIDEKKSEMMVTRVKLIKPTIILWEHCGHIYVPSVHN
jgi:hypothetical protein